MISFLYEMTINVHVQMATTCDMLINYDIHTATHYSQQMAVKLSLVHKTDGFNIVSDYFQHVLKIVSGITNNRYSVQLTQYSFALNSASPA